MKIYPFKALRPTSDFVGMVTSKSTDFPDKEDLVHELRVNAFTFHHVTKSHLSYTGAFQEPEKFLPFAAHYLKEMKKKGALIKEEKDSLYIYEQTRKDGRQFKGIIALCSVSNYNNNKIKKHEEIRTNRLKYLVELFKTTKVMGEPTLLTYEGDLPMDNIYGDEILSFMSVDKKKHKVTRLSSEVDIAKIQSYMNQIESFYIADGHHRCASNAVFHQNNPSFNNDKLMCFILPENQLEIKSFHRLIKSSGITVDEVINKLSENFTVTKSAKSLYSLENERDFGVYMDEQWYKVRYTKDITLLDVQVIEEYIVKYIFGIADSRTNSQISFHPHTAGEDTLVSLINDGMYTLAVTNRASTFEDVRMISDKQMTLPPKSTYIEPKLRAGMIIQDFR